MKNIFFVLITWAGTFVLHSQEQNISQKLESLDNRIQNLSHSFSSLEKASDDLMWYNKLGDIAFIDKLALTGPPVGEKKGQMAGSNNPVYFKNPLNIYMYLFVPKGIDGSKKYPVMVFIHGGVHGNFGTVNAHIVRELVAQGYIVIAPEYRGSNGYGRGYYESIDYGGLENQDVKACRDFAVENYEIVDEKRIGIMGWSHGGMITLMNIFDYPEGYQAAYAGVPVSDVIARMGYKPESYRGLFSAPYHIGKTAHEDPDEYRRRSPAWNAHKLQNTPLLIHTNTNDPDVNSLEVEHLIHALKAHNKKFEYEIYENMPGGHTFDRIDTKAARDIRFKIYQFLGNQLNPPNKFKNVKEMARASYGF